MMHAGGYLHSRRIVHRDLKTENFLLLGQAGTPEENVLKLCDFGTAVLLSDRMPRSMDNIGTLSYTAPEVYFSKGADCPADCWSLGVVLYVLLTGTNPFRVPGNNAKEDTIRRIRQGNFDQRRSPWQRLSLAAQDLVKHLLVLEEPQRLTCVKALRHPWLKTGKNCFLARGSADSPGLAPHAPRLVTLLLRLSDMAEAQRLALAACAMAASEADISMLALPWRELFLALDEDQDGRLSFIELAAGLKRLLGPAAKELPDEQLEECVLALDLDHSGAIEWVEFIAIALLGSKAISEAEEPLSTAFRLLDRPWNGNVASLQDDASQIIGRWVSEEYQEVGDSENPTVAFELGEGNAKPNEGIGSASPRLTLSDLRFAVGSTEVYEML